MGAIEILLVGLAIGITALAGGTFLALLICAAFAFLLPRDDYLDDPPPGRMSPPPSHVTTLHEPFDWADDQDGRR